MQTLYIVLALLAMAVALFALQNADQVTVTFLAWKLQSPLAAVILGSVAAGGIIAILLNLPHWFRSRREIRQLSNRLRELEARSGPDPTPPHSTG